MTTSTSVTGSMADPFTSTAAPDPPPKCTVCKSDLTIRDKQKTTKNYWKNCQSCRDKMKTAATNRKRLLTPASSTIDVAPDTPAKKRRKNPAKAAEPKEKFCRFPRKSVPKKSPPQNIIASDEDLSPKYRSELEAMRKALQSEHEKRDKGNEKREIHVEEIWDEPHNYTLSERPDEKECSSCADFVLAERFPSLEGCDHDDNVCQECLVQWMNQRLASAENVTCPSSGCTNAVTYADVRKFAPRDVFTR